MHRTRLLPALALLAPLALAAQDIPPYVPANPLLESRSALYGQPFVPARTGWRIQFITDYYNAVEVDRSGGANSRQSIFDAEVLQADLWVTHDVSKRAFVLADLPLRGGYSGFLDGFLIWYHHTTGLSVPARDELPRNTFQWGVVLPDTNIDRTRPGTFLGDLRTGAGLRFGRVELIASVTLPTATLHQDGWTRHVIGTSLAVAGDVLRTSRVVVNASATAGITPPQGRLAKYQRASFVGGMVSGRWRFAGEQAVYASVWGQSGNWKGTGFAAVDDAEVTGDYGFLLRVKRRWPELQLGMKEDLMPKGPAMDVAFTIGLRW